MIRPPWAEKRRDNLIYALARHARIASATRVDFFVGGVDALVVSFFILEAAAAMASMVGAGAQGRRAARNGPGGCQLIQGLGPAGRRRRAPLVFVIKDPPRRGCLSPRTCRPRECGSQSGKSFSTELVRSWPSLNF